MISAQLLRLLVDVVVQCKRVTGRFRITEIYYRSASGPAAPTGTVTARG